MGKMLDALNRSRKDKVDVEILENVDKYDLYEKALLSGDYLEVNFDLADKTGSLVTADDNGVQLVLKSDDIKLSMDFYNAGMKHRFIQYPLEVRVVSVDRDSNTVYLRPEKSDRADKAAKEADIVGKIYSEIKNELKKGNTPRVWGKVIWVNDKRAGVYLFDRAVFACINASEWQKSYTRFLYEVCKENAIYEFDVIGVGTRRNEGSKEAALILSRREITGDPWERIDDTYITEGGVIQVKAIEVPEDKNFFWGTSRRLPGIEIFCNLNEKLNIQKGLVYNCVIKKVDFATHQLRVTPFEYCEESGRVVAVLKKKITEDTK